MYKTLKIKRPTLMRAQVRAAMGSATSAAAAVHSLLLTIVPLPGHFLRELQTQATPSAHAALHFFCLVETCSRLERQATHLRQHLNDFKKLTELNARMLRPARTPAEQRGRGQG